MVAKSTLILTLTMTRGVGTATITRILTRNDLLAREPDVFFSLSPESMREEYGIPAKVAEDISIHRKTLLQQARDLEHRMAQFGVEIVTIPDAHYPTAIESFDPDPPGVLFFYGNMRLLDGRTFAVLSSRKSAPSSLERIERLTEEGVLNGEILVSGHNTPEYMRAAVVPLRWGAPRILALDQGFFHALGNDLSEEPFRTARLWRYQFDPRTDLVVSRVQPQEQGNAGSNRLRDRLVGSIAKRLDIVEVASGGNMENIAKLSLSAGRPVRLMSPAPHLAEVGADALPS